MRYFYLFGLKRTLGSARRKEDKCRNCPIQSKSGHFGCKTLNESASTVTRNLELALFRQAIGLNRTVDLGIREKDKCKFVQFHQNQDVFGGKPLHKVLVPGQEIQS